MDLHDFVISEYKVKWIDHNTVKLGKDGAKVTLKVPQNVAEFDFHYRRVKKSGLKVLYKEAAYKNTVRTHTSESERALTSGQTKTYRNREDYQEGSNWVEDQDIFITFTGANVKEDHPEHPDPDPVDDGGGGGSNVVDPDPSSEDDTGGGGDKDGDNTAEWIAVGVALAAVGLLIMYFYMKKKNDSGD